MQSTQSLVLQLPLLSNQAIIEMHRAFVSMLQAFESHHGLVLWSHYEQLPQHERPERFKREPF